MKKGRPASKGFLAALAKSREPLPAVPMRFRLSRQKGHKLPPQTVKVDRMTKWGNPHTFQNSGEVHPVMRFACETLPLWDVGELRGKNLACWCYVCPAHADGKPFDVECSDCHPCHADLIGLKANA